ncbi:hypothetical protein [Paenibacillus terrigena]|uniref:hypothetical protein n=1 Tax=Paenibacillus terrigena TaxID=369333 RepID=UPI000475C2DC|nr:hypothetical protein [Paenibacillus terrigena]
MLNGSTAEHIAFTGTGTAYDPETGEALIYAPAATHRVVSLSQYTAHRERKSFRGRQDNFTFSVLETLHEVTSVLTRAQRGFLFLLQCYINYDDGRLISANKSPMTTEDMRKALKMDGRRKKSSFYDFLNRCVEHGIILANEDGSYSVNERYHFRGTSQTGLSVIKSYTAKIKRMYGTTRPEDLGLIYTMLQLTHYGSNTLCANPSEQVPEKVRSLNRKELASVLGISVGEISRRFPTFTVDGEYVIAKVSVGGVDSYMFNPWIFYRKMTQPDETLRTIFRVKAK